MLCAKPVQLLIVFTLALGSLFLAVGAHALSRSIAATQTTVNNQILYLPMIVRPALATLVATLTDPNPHDGGSFGRAVAIQDTAIAVTNFLPNEAFPSVGSGTLTIWENTGANNWAFAAQFTSDNPNAIDYYGRSLAIDNQTIVVGAPRDNEAGDRAGAVYIYEKTNGAWQRVAKLTATDAKPNADFGWSVALDNDTLAVGSLTEGNTYSGSVYIFSKQGNSWQQVAKFVPENPERYDYFGRVVAVDGNRVAVGRSGDNKPCQSCPPYGAVYLYEKGQDSTWSFTTKLTGDTYDVQQLGEVLAIEADVLVVAAREDTVVILENDGSGWENSAILYNDEDNYDAFGGALAINKQTIVAGASGEYYQYANAGAAYMIQKNAVGEWAINVHLVAAMPTKDMYFGGATAIDNTYLVIGASGASSTFSGEGAVYVYKLSP